MSSHAFSAAWPPPGADPRADGNRGPTIDEIIDGQRIGVAAYFVAALTLMVMVCDGFDLAALGYIAPELLKEWRLPAPAMVPALTSGIVGMMIGGPLVGLLGDRLGRRPMMIACLALMGASTLAAIGVHTVDQLAILRLLTGIALGGALPIAGALIAEASPARHRGRFLTLVLTGPAVGIALTGLVTAALVPAFGWRSLLVVGGVVPLVLLAASILLLPESVHFLATRPERAAELRRAIARLRPDLAASDGTPAAAETQARQSPFATIGRLFKGDLGIVTPLLWSAQVTIQTSSFFALTWLPTLLQSAGASTAQAGLNSALFSIGGLCSCLLLVMTVDRWGAFVLTALLAVGAPLVAMMIDRHVPAAVHAPLIAMAGFCVIGAQLCITVLLGLFYPVAIKSSGIGTTQAVGRLGALAAPIGGGIMLEMGIGFDRLPIGPAALLLLGAIAAGAIGMIGCRRFGSARPASFS